MMFVEEIKQDCPGHEPVSYEVKWNMIMDPVMGKKELTTSDLGHCYKNICRHCGVELQAEWREKK
jgi:hypothetical protein